MRQVGTGMTERSVKHGSRLALAQAAALVCAAALAAGCGPSGSLERARAEMDQRRLYTAIKTLTEVIGREPENVDALVARGQCYLKLMRYDAARSDMERVLKLRPGLIAARLGLAEVLVGERKYDEALAAAEMIAEESPDSIGPYAVNGRAHHALFQSAARDCVKIFEDRRRDSLAAAAAVEIRLGRFGSAEECLDRWYASDPGGATRSGLRQALDEAKRQFQLAVDNLAVACGQAAGRPGSPDPDTVVLLAAVLYDQGDYDQAERVADQALALKGVNRVQATVIKAEVLGERSARLMREGVAQDDSGKRAEAVRLGRQATAMLEKILRQYPSAAVVRDKLVMHYLRAGMLDEAEDLMRPGAAQPRGPMTHYFRGLVHLAKGEFRSAATELLTIRDVMDNDPGYHFNLGLAYYGNGGENASIALATTEFRRVTELAPNFVPARFRLAKLYLRGKWYEEALAQCEHILAIPGRPERLNAPVYLMLSEANRGLNNYDEVLKWLDRAVGEAPSEEALMVQAFVMLEQGMADELIQKYDPDSVKDTSTFACIRGYAYLKKGMAKQAIDNFKKVLMLNRDYIMGYVHLAHAYEVTGKLADAAGQYELAIQRVSDLRLDETRYPDLRFNLALVRIKQGQFEKAREQLEKVVEFGEGPRYIQARLRLASIDLREGQLEKARTEVERVIVTYKDTAEARFLAGLIYSALARRPDREVRIAIAERKGPGTSTDRITDREIDAERRVYWDHAAENYEKAIDFNPRFRFSYDVGTIYAVQGRFDKMIPVYLRALEAAPPAARPEILRNLATAYQGAGDFDKAVATAREALDTISALPKPDLNGAFRARFVLVNCLIAQGDFAGARTAVTEAADMLTGFRTAYLEMIGRLARGGGGAGPEREALAGQAYRIVGRELNLALLFSRTGVAWLPYAEQSYQKVLRYDKKNIVAMSYLGDLYAVTGRLGEAEEINRRILELSPWFAPALRQLAAIEEDRSRAAAEAETTPEERLNAQAKAIELYEAAIKAEPDFWVPRLELAAIYQRAGVSDKALKLYEDVIRLNPTQVAALNDYANLCAEENRNLDKAIEYATKASELSPLSGAVADTLGVLHTILGEPGAAVEQLERARYLLPGNPTVMYHLAVACNKSGNKERALVLLDELLATDDQFPERDEAVKLRDTLRGE